MPTSRYSALPAHFIEKIKCSLQVQAALEQQLSMLGATAALASSGAIASQRSRMYSTAVLPNTTSMERFTGPIDVIKQTVKIQGITGMWKGFGVSLVYRTSFAVSCVTCLYDDRLLTRLALHLGHVRRQVTAIIIFLSKPLISRRQVSNSSAECFRNSRGHLMNFLKMRQISWQAVWRAISTG